MKNYKTGTIKSYQNALRIKNSLMFDKKNKNVRIKKNTTSKGWVISYKK